jgi:predicted phosphodiesterase
MNVLALYDIHGNSDALRAVLADPRAADPDAVVVGGDVVPGPFASASLARLRAINAPTHWLRGNGEREVAAAIDGPAPTADDVSGRTASLTAAEIGTSLARNLAARPLCVQLDGVLYCHATPRSDEELVTRISPPEHLAEVLSGVEEELVVGGHTHQQDARTAEGRRFVNAGSVGLPYEGDGAARWLWVADGVPHLQRTEYDAAAAGARMMAIDWPDRRSVTAALTDPLDPMTVTKIFEGRR